ncbi:hypothetical protein FIU83_13060 [Halomonas sp. THAF5a]|nr:hypothetical protein FIU83_13060 [Halomonas sp. THAF5a]
MPDWLLEFKPRGGLINDAAGQRQIPPPEYALPHPDRITTHIIHLCFDQGAQAPL